MDVLQSKIRKRKCPLVIDFSIPDTFIPPHLQKDKPRAEIYADCCCELLAGLRGMVPAVRFSMGAFAVMGPEGMTQLQRTLHSAREGGFYVFLDGPELLSPWLAKHAAAALAAADAGLEWDGLILSAYLGSDVLRPFLPAPGEQGKDLFVVVRSANKSAPEMQDLLTGSRLAHMALADQVARLGADRMEKCGYSSVGMVAAATAPSSVKSLREKYKSSFLLVDGYDYPGGNGKNCAAAFDRLGHGAIVCAGGSVTGAWLTEQSDGREFVRYAQEAVGRIQRNLARFVTVL